jgi:hypothetical protein
VKRARPGKRTASVKITGIAATGSAGTPTIAKRAKPTLPFNSANWWPLNDAFRDRYAKTGYDEFAIDDLQRALESGDLPAMLRQDVAGKPRYFQFKSPKFWREGVRLAPGGKGVRLLYRNEYARKSLLPALR